MKYHIDTIPVWDAYKEPSECPLCDLEAHNEQMYVDNFLGASVMEPDVRVEVNEKGFCGPHFAMMIGQKNRLGLALMTHTHLQETIKAMPTAAPAKRGLFARKESAAPQADPADRCILCERLNTTMERYVYTVLHLYKTDKAFAEALEGGKGHCLRHHRQLIAMAPQALGGKADAFTQMLEGLQLENMQRIEKELEWFTLKFDYRNTDKPWGNSRDALERAINKLRGRSV